MLSWLPSGILDGKTILSHRSVVRVKRSISFHSGSARSVVVLYQEDLESKMKELYDCVPEQMSRWVVADDTWMQTRKLITQGDFGFVDEQGAREVFVESMEHEAMKTGISLLKV